MIVWAQRLLKILITKAPRASPYSGGSNIYSGGSNIVRIVHSRWLPVA